MTDQPWLDFAMFSRFRLIRQAETSECGLACVAMVANHHGMQVEVGTLRRHYEASSRGTTARDLTQMADRIGMSTRVVRCELTDLDKLRLPAILHWNLGHFVVLHRVRGRRLHVADPSAGLQRFDLTEASPHFSGIAIEFAPTPRFERKLRDKPMSLRQLIKGTPGMALSFAQAMLLSLMLQAALLLVPLYMQMVIDEGLQRGDRDILTLLLIAVLGVSIFAAVATFLRGLTVQFMTQMLAFDMNSAVFTHLVRLPISYFQKRQVGDLQQRFRSLQPIQQALGSGAVSGIIDGVLSIGTAGLMLLYNLPLAALSFAFVLLLVIVRLASLRANRSAAGAALIADAREQSRFLETLRTIATIKVNAAEEERTSIWRSNAAASINAQVKRGNIANTTAAINQLVIAISDAVVIFVGAQMALQGQLTVGVLTAFLAYKALFSSRISGLLDQSISFALLDVQLERVADIVLTPREERIDDPGSGEPIRGELELKDVSFRYSPYDPLILSAVNLRIEAGEFIALTGRSGGGKSTLLRLLVGLNQPTTGTVLLDGQSLATLGARPVREQISFVMQDDQLFAGTILDNITLFSAVPDLERVEQALKMAQIHEEIASLPMGLGSLIGDMGSVFSGGQRQRLMIARALYRQPRVLVMDEATSHVDLTREARINAALQEMKVTRVIVAHRMETIRAADRVFTLTDGSLRSAA